MSDQRPADPVPAVRSLETLYRQEYAAVVALAHVLSGSRSTAEELAQEAFMAAHRRWGAISQYDDPRGLGPPGLRRQVHLPHTAPCE